MYRTCATFLSGCYSRLLVGALIVGLTGCSLPHLGGLFSSSGPELLISEQPWHERYAARTIAVRKEAEPKARWRGVRPPVPLPPFVPPLELQFNREVARQLDRFTRKDRRFVPEALQRREPYYQMLAEVLRDEGVPLELMNVALIESAFRRRAKSPSGAVGLWQFTKGTGRAYGLRVSLFHDDRTDPILSTIAAARHLRDLYQAYHDWNLVLAAYNAGTGAVDRARLRAKSDDFWEISRRKELPRQTREYVPRFIAVSQILRDPARYGFGEEVVRLARSGGHGKTGLDRTVG